MEINRCYELSDLKRWSIFAGLDTEFLLKIKLAYIFGTTGNNAIMVTQDDEVFSVGSNKSGCLGIGNELLTLTPTKVKALCKKHVKGFTSGSGGHVIANTELGDVYMWGYSYYPIIGEQHDTFTFTPTAVCPNICGGKVVDVASGHGHILFLTEKSEVYCLGGFNESYSARMKVEFYEEEETEDKDEEAVEEIVEGEEEVVEGEEEVAEGEETNRVIAVACGANSCVAVMESGKVFAWGFNDKSQLGIVIKGYHCSPGLVTSLSAVVIRKVACGCNHTIALSDVGKLYTWGDNTYGQLGIEGVQESLPTSVTLGPHRVVDIAATHYCDMSAAMTENWKVYIWGKCGCMATEKPMETSFMSLYDAFAMYATPRVTWKPIQMYCLAGETIAESWRNAFDDPSNSDLIIKVDGKPIYVHKCLLKIRCQHFRSMFQKHWKEDHENALSVNQFSYITYRSFLHHLYTDELDVPVEHVMELFDLAKSYCETRLKKKCEQMVKNSVTVENASILYSTLSQYNVKELEGFLLEFCKNNLMEIIKTEAFNALDAQIGMDLIRKVVRPVDAKQ